MDWIAVAQDRDRWRALVLIGKPEGTKPLGRPRRRYGSNIKMYLQEVRWGGMDWIALAQDRNRWRALILIGKPEGKKPLGRPRRR
jgi:hypothetical protein